MTRFAARFPFESSSIDERGMPWHQSYKPMDLYDLELAATYDSRQEGEP